MGDHARSCVWLFLLAFVGGVPLVLGESADDIQKFLAQSEEKMVFDENHKQVTLVFGITGAGKTSFIQWIAGDDSKLVSVERGLGDFVIVDNNRIGNSTIISKTTYPELVVDKVNGEAFYDVSGFGDTRGIKNDIATSYFIKRVIDHVDKVKILLVTSFTSVRPGGDRKELLRLLKHVVELVKNTGRYLDGVGLVVTKVDNIYSRGKLVSDEAIIANIAEFLDEVAMDIESLDTDQDLDFRVKISELLFKLTETTTDQKMGAYNKIMLFRRPDDTGALSLMPALQQGKQRARTVISENLQFIIKHDEDFKYTVSDETKHKLQNLIIDLKENLDNNVVTIIRDLHEYYELTINTIQSNIQNAIKTSDIEKAESDLTIAQMFAKIVEEGSHHLLTLAIDIKNVQCCKNIPVLIKDTISNLNVPISQQEIISLSSEANFLEFINNSSILEFNFNINSLQRSIQEEANKLKELSSQVKPSIDRLSATIEENTKRSFRLALTRLAEKISQTKNDVHDLTELKTQMFNHYNTLIESQQPSHTRQKISKLRTIFTSFKIEVSNHVWHKLEDAEYYDFFKNELSNLIQYFNGLKEWYEFLDKFYNVLSSYDTQSNDAVQTRCKALTQSIVNYRGRNVENTNIDFILRDCNRGLYDEEFQKIKSVNLTVHNVELLNNVVHFALNDNGLSYDCSNYKLIVKGRFVKLSAVKMNSCYGMSSLEIIGLEKVFIDKDIDFTGQHINMIVIAPQWEVVGDRKIILDGAPGAFIYPMKAAAGQDGKPGNPGGNAGNFLGYGDVIEGSEHLFISANGGNGSAGQEGGDGEPGKDGVVPEIKHDSLEYLSVEQERHDNVEYWIRRNFKVSQSNRYLCDFPLIFCRDYEVRGTSCGDGGDGGRGGVGGAGGAAGVVRVPYIEFSAKNGNDGANAPHGQGGKAGHCAATISVHERRECYVLFKTKFYSQTGIQYHECSSGRTPRGPGNYSGRPARITRNSNVLDNIEFNPAIGEFKAYLQQNLNNTFRKNYLQTVLNKAHF